MVAVLAAGIGVPRTTPALVPRATRVLIRVDGAGGTHGLATADPPPAGLLGRLLLRGDLNTIQAKLAFVPVAAWTPAYDFDGRVRPGAWVAEAPACSTWLPGRRGCD